MARLAPETSLLPFLVVGRCRSCSGTVRELDVVENQRYKYFRFGWPYRCFLFSSMSHLFVETFFQSAVVENFAFAARVAIIFILGAFCTCMGVKFRQFQKESCTFDDIPKNFCLTFSSFILPPFFPVFRPTPARNLKLGSLPPNCYESRLSAINSV